MTQTSSSKASAIRGDAATSDPVIVILVGAGSSGRAFYHRLRRELPHASLHVVVERPVPRKDLLRARMRKLGMRRVAGQLMFLAYARAILEPRGQRRCVEIAREHDLDLSDFPVDAVSHVPSVNSDECRVLLARLAPRVVVLAGTRIVGRETLRATPTTFVNMHAGVTPGYRGVHGGYWALADGRSDLVGTTIHLVDEGIDTGRVIEQRFFATTPDDQFATYPMLQVAAGLPALVDAVKGVLAGSTTTREGAAHPSSLRSHPTLWQYAKGRVLRGVR